ncbi:hypothetical protein [Paenibacillus sp. MMS18-CY102]|uniref:hypothetical protein n=1 Tax=Paenibacillus sp. MMS18-CY102 TaxID=2682849 RepID=UPI001366195B|nr:hypothetical protein [Paenibacillus sp. MMS18-CY102]MWC26622.1 hypothetical protein [Paenibacillus sp. MMS18-CY102]
MQIGRKIYYELATGNVIVDTGERSGSVVTTTQEQDFEMYAALAERVPDTVGVLELEYGQYGQDFAECGGYRINTETGTLEFVHSEPDNIEQQPTYQQPLTEQLADLKQKQALMQAALDELILGGAL